MKKFLAAILLFQVSAVTPVATALECFTAGGVFQSENTLRRITVTQRADGSYLLVDNRTPIFIDGLTYPDDRESYRATCDESAIVVTALGHTGRIVATTTYNWNGSDFDISDYGGAFKTWKWVSP